MARRILILAACMLSAVAPGFYYSAAGQSPETLVRFRWALGALTGPKASRVFVSVRDGTVLQSGDQVKLFVSPLSSCSIFVFFHSAQGQLELLFPPDARQPALKPGTPYYVPPGQQWLQLDEQVGRERIYVLASATRLTRFEELVARHASADPASGATKTKLAADVLAEMQTLRLRAFDQQATAERPVEMGGLTRSIPPSPDVATLASEISAVGFYSRTISIDHR